MLDFIKKLFSPKTVSTVFANGLFAFLIVSAVMIAAAILLSHFVKRLFQRFGEKKGRDYRFLASLVCAVIWGFTAYGVLEQILPLQKLAVSLLAGSGVAAIVIGLAAQESVANLISGALIVLYRPIETGDLVRINGLTGTVEEITLRHTVLRTVENSRVVVPNSIVNSSTLENLNMQEQKKCNFLDIGIAYDADPDLAMQLMREEILAHPDFLDVRTDEEKASDVPPVTFRCTMLGESSVTLRAVIWSRDVATGIAMLSDLRLSVLRRFREAGIEIPYPYRNIIQKNA